jgi:hypothetical protein
MSLLRQQTDGSVSTIINDRLKFVLKKIASHTTITVSLSMLLVHHYVCPSNLRALVQSIAIIVIPFLQLTKCRFSQSGLLVGFALLIAQTTYGDTFRLPNNGGTITGKLVATSSLQSAIRQANPTAPPAAAPVANEAQYFAFAAQGVNLLNSRYYMGALAAFDSAIRIDPNHYEAWH